MKSFEAYFRVLGLPASAGPEETTAAFRRLVKQFHPDVNPTRDGHRRFVEVAEAYAVLRDKMRIRSPESCWDRCPRCGRYADLFDSLYGGRACANCLLGRTRLQRYLPLPVIVMAKHLAVFGLYATCIGLLIVYLRTGARGYAVMSLLSVLTGLVVLAIDVILLTHVSAAYRAARVNR